MLDWEFDELIEDVQEGMKMAKEDSDHFSLMAICLNDFENAFEIGEISEIIVILSMFIIQFECLVIKSGHYKLLEETIKKYVEMDKENITLHQKRKIEETIDFYNKNIEKMKIWCGTKNNEKVFCQIIFDEDGNKKMVEIGENILDSDFDDLVEIVHDLMEASDDRENKPSIMGLCLEELEEEMEKGEIENITILLTAFYEQSKYFEMFKEVYFMLEKAVENYKEKKELNLSKRQKNKIDDLIDYYNENIINMKLQGEDVNNNIAYFSVKIDNNGNKILEEIKEKSL
ncbi:hypothetical protein [Sebaldella sp. S0638]|uniref:hypothetical protein n=1 Tax=Sebaldella sp. S0638 TaxID=2957809 RepID=UPI00209FB77C|nr:hypothetical protein [Sebaldella sp. S0638]MCP1226454.1 hypothetical protein [Sebaldella sp. S0638]